MGYILWYVLLSLSAFLAWFYLNSRQWLLAFLWLPALLAAVAWWLEGGGMAICIYFLSLGLMMMPHSSLFSLVFYGIVMRNEDWSQFKSWENWDIREMWRNPSPMRKRG